MSVKLMVGGLWLAVFFMSIAAMPPKTIALGSPMPEFKLSDLGGKPVRSSRLQGRVVLLDLWATWCEPCLADIPMLNRLHEKFSSRGLQVIGIAVQSGRTNDIRPHVANLGIKYLVLVGTEKTVDDYVAVGFPITYLIGKDGKIIKKYLGSLPDQEREKETEMDRDIENLLQ